MRVDATEPTPLAQRAADRPLLILDLDETLVYATDHPPRPPRVDFTVGPFAVCERPFVRSFLAQVREWFDVAVWTSSSTVYASAIVAHLFGGDAHALRFVWCSDRCTRRLDGERGEYYWVKDLRKVKRAGYPLARVIVVDDSPEKLERHYGNHVRVTPFTGDPADRELLDLLPFLDRLRSVPNVRTVEKRAWRARR